MRRTMYDADGAGVEALGRGQQHTAIGRGDIQAAHFHPHAAVNGLHNQSHLVVGFLRLGGGLDDTGEL